MTDLYTSAQKINTVLKRYAYKKRLAKRKHTDIDKSNKFIKQLWVRFF